VSYRIALIAALLTVFALPASASAATAALPPVGHVFVIVLENKTFADTFGPTGRVNAPYLNNTLVPMGELLTKYYGVGHNSADNYIAMVSGQPPTPSSKDDCPGDPPMPVADSAIGPYGIATSDGCDYPARFLTIGDQLSAHGLTWKGYNSGIPAPCSLAHDNGHYARKHNPWVFFQSVRDSGQCEQDVVGLDQLPTDLLSIDTTPNLSYIVPDQCEDAHDNCTGPLPSNPIIDDQYALQQADAFLGVWVPKILNSPAFKQDGLLVINFDESVGDSTACCGEMPGPADPAPGGYVAGEPGQIGAGGGITGAVLISPFISPGSEQPTGLHLNNTDYNHYSLLRSLEDLFGLGDHLGYAAPSSVVPFGSDVFDPIPPAAPPACAAAPQSVFTITRRATGLSVNGRSTSACGTAIRVVQVAVARRADGQCSWLTVSGHPHSAGACSRPSWLLADGGGNGWRIAIPGGSAGRYVVRVRAIDSDGHAETARAVRLS
jgi:hypothetical protein